MKSIRTPVIPRFLDSRSPVGVEDMVRGKDQSGGRRAFVKFSQGWAELPFPLSLPVSQPSVRVWTALQPFQRSVCVPSGK